MVSVLRRGVAGRTGLLSGREPRSWKRRSDPCPRKSGARACAGAGPGLAAISGAQANRSYKRASIRALAKLWSRGGERGEGGKKAWVIQRTQIASDAGAVDYPASHQRRSSVRYLRYDERMRLGMRNLVWEIEERFDVALPASELAQVRTVRTWPRRWSGSCRFRPESARRRMCSMSSGG